MDPTGDALLDHLGEMDDARDSGRAGADLLDLGREQTHDYFLPDGTQVPELHEH